MESTNKYEETSTLLDGLSSENVETTEKINQRWDLFLSALLKNGQIDLEKTSRETKALIQNEKLGVPWICCVYYSS